MREAGASVIQELYGVVSSEFLAERVYSAMAKSDPTKDPEFKRVLGNLLSAPPKLHSEMKLGKKRGRAEAKPRPLSRQKRDNRSKPS